MTRRVKAAFVLVLALLLPLLGGGSVAHAEVTVVSVTATWFGYPGSASGTCANQQCTITASSDFCETVTNAGPLIVSVQPCTASLSVTMTDVTATCTGLGVGSLNVAGAPYTAVSSTDAGAGPYLGFIVGPNSPEGTAGGVVAASCVDDTDLGTWEGSASYVIAI